MSSRAMSSQSASSQQLWPGRNHVALFVRCLHLLDFDLLQDWPGVTEQLFAAKTAQQTLQQRVKAVEWSLYRLFEMHDPSETKDKLRPFFPPATQLQSLNLRAALYRCLTELKKNGVLGKDISLRKTMLDDCKGERFDEVLASFAMSVLRKRMNTPLNMTGGTLSDAQLVHVILAYRALLQSNLKARKEVTENAKQQVQQLEAAEMDLRQRLEDAKAVTTKNDILKQNELSAKIHSNWIGNNAWTDLLLRGLPGRRVLAEESPGDAAVDLSDSQGLLHDLEARIQKHQARLLEWKVIAKDLTTRQGQEEISMKPDLMPVPNGTSTSLRFSQHKALNLAEWKARSATQPSMDGAYVSLLEALEKELAAFSTSTKKPNLNRTNASPQSAASLVDHQSPSPSDAPHNKRNQQEVVARVPRIDLVPPPVIESSKRTILGDKINQSVSPSPVQSSDEDSPWIPNQQSSATTVHNHPTPLQDCSPLTTQVPEPPMSPSKIWMSLADRTRASMSLSSRQSILPDSNSSISHHTERSDGQSLPDFHPSSDDDHHTTLLERTRKSISILSNSSAARHRKAKLEKRTSQVHPVNQFHTSIQPQPQAEQNPGSRASTPRDLLFEEDAEYASVFKSRPKVALSPAFSPQQKASGLNSILEHDIDRLVLDSGEDVD